MTRPAVDTLLPASPTKRPADLYKRLAAIEQHLAVAATSSIGFPAARDIDYRPLAPLLGHLINNVGDPDDNPLHPGHVHDLEREVLDFLAGLFRAAPGWSGYVTTGGTEGNLHGLWQGRTKLPNAVVYHSTAAHYSVAKACRLLGLPAVAVDTEPSDEISYTALFRASARRRSRPAIVVANIGTTMTEAVDDVSRIHAALDDAGVNHRWVHSDAALSGIPLAGLANRPAFDLADGADSLSISGHKFLGTPVVCGVVLTRRSHAELAPAVRYIGSRDTTVSGSRSGIAAVMLWYATQLLGPAGLANRANRARETASYTVARLQNIGWPAWRNPHAMTVMLRQLPTTLSARWPLPGNGDWAHLICMPGISRSQIDNLVNAVAAASTN